MPIRIVGVNGEILDVILNNTFQGETFVETVNFDVSEVLFDPDVDIISRNNIITLSVNTFEIENSLIIYPNPTANFINIQKPDGLTIHSIQIFDVLGKLVLETDFKESINTEILSSGVHFVKFSTNEGIFHKRLLKE